MKSNIERHGDICVITPVGDIKIGAGAEALREAVQREIDAGVKKMVLNLAEVGYVDSSGLGEMIACLKRAAEAGGDLKLANRRKRVSDLFQLTRLETVFSSYDTVEEALSSYR